MAIEQAEAPALRLTPQPQAQHPAIRRPSRLRVSPQGASWRPALVPEAPAPTPVGGTDRITPVAEALPAVLAPTLPPPRPPAESFAPLPPIPLPTRPPAPLPPPPRPPAAEKLPAVFDAPPAVLDAPPAVLDAPPAVLDAPPSALDAPPSVLDAPPAAAASPSALDARPAAGAPASAPDTLPAAAAPPPAPDTPPLPPNPRFTGIGEISGPESPDFCESGGELVVPRWSAAEIHIFVTRLGRADERRVRADLERMHRPSLPDAGLAFPARFDPDHIPVLGEELEPQRSRSYWPGWDAPARSLPAVPRPRSAVERFSTDVRSASFRPGVAERRLATRRVVRRDQLAPTSLLEVFSPATRVTLDDGAEATFTLGSAWRVVAIARVDELLGFGLVPTAAPFVDAELGGRGAIQLHPRGVRRAPDPQRMAVLDYVTARSLPNHERGAIRSDFLTEVVGQRLRPDVLAQVRDVDADTLRALLRHSGVRQSAAEGAVRRLREIQRHHMIIGEEWRGRLIGAGGHVVPKRRPSAWVPSAAERRVVEGDVEDTRVDVAMRAVASSRLSELFGLSAEATAAFVGDPYELLGEQWQRLLRRSARRPIDRQGTAVIAYVQALSDGPPPENNGRDQVQAIRSDSLRGILGEPLDAGLVEAVRAVAPALVEDMLLQTGWSKAAAGAAGERLLEVQRHGRIIGEVWRGELEDGGYNSVRMPLP